MKTLGSVYGITGFFYPPLPQRAEEICQR